MSKERVDAFEKAMNVVCGECGNTDGAQCDECWVKRSWSVMNGKPDSPTPKRNPNVAETVGYECKNDPLFKSREVLLHQATVRWNSGKSFECHAPERIELRIGGTSYEYKAI